MDELTRLLDAWHGLDRECADGVLATVVHVTGSAYRRPGARMLVLPHGQRVGTVSGGCLEGEISRKAWWFTESDRPVVRVYDTSSSDDAVSAFGLGCNGVVHVMLERVANPRTANLLTFIDSRRKARSTVVVATVIAAHTGSDAQVGDRLFVDASGMGGGTLAGRSCAAEVHAQAMRTLREGFNCLAHLSGCAVFVERIAPPLELVIFGAGDDAQPLATMAGQMGWTVTVADGRPAYAQAARFPGADRVVVLSRGDLLDGISIGPDTAVVMMTHNYPLDFQLLPLVLERRPRYLGLLGPRTRAEQIFDELGLEMAPNVYAPLGLDLGADSPAAIALSIAAELQAVVSGRSGAMLRLREHAIHAPVVEVGEVTVASVTTRERPGTCETLAGSHAA